MFRAGGAIAVSVVAIGIGSGTAYGAATRAEYDAQVNPICAAASAQDQQLSTQAEERFAQLHRELRKARGQRREKLLARDRKLSSSLPDRHLRIRYAELGRLRSIPAAPGDEGLVATWLDARQRNLDLNRKLNRIDQQVERLLKRTSKTIDIGTLDRLDRRIKELDKRANRFENKVIAAESTDFDLGTELGANDCVTDIL